jgi:nucleotide-binding universal stress UspA family protein
MFKKFIIAADMSEDSLKLMVCAGKLKAYGAKKCLLIQFRTVEEVIDYTSGQSNVPRHKYEEFVKENERILNDEGYEVETRILAGYPATEIEKIAFSDEYPLIVVGARKGTPTGDIYFNALANDLMHSVSIPLLIMRPGITDITKEGNRVIIDGCEVDNHLLYPTDFSDNADIAFSKVLEMAPGRAKKVTLLHVQDAAKIRPHLDDKVEEFNRIDKARLEGMKKLLQEMGDIEVDVIVKYGSPAVEIIKAVEELGVQLVVMGSQGRGYVKEFFLGSVSSKVARKALSSVLLIPTKR